MDLNTTIDVIYETEDGGALAYKHCGVKAIECLDDNGIKRRISLESFRRLFRPVIDSHNPDPWKHRSTGMKCRTCMWVSIKERTITEPVPDCPAEPGYFQQMRARDVRVCRCRRHAPTMNGYPVVFEDDWCGDHKLDENKA
jgi:hypothetical protein